jgi:hypothetical protein
MTGVGEINVVLIIPYMCVGGLLVLMGTSFVVIGNMGQRCRRDLFI